ncbi:MAG: 2-C-methyl-D-erythritol 2,4-cyclodiphosphate synthase [Mangrovibacterium sp.]
MVRVGFGFDVHRLAEGETLWLGGVQLEHYKGTVAHSDGDVVLHAISDALLGAAKLRDIGYHFPNTDPKYKNADSKMLLQECMKLVEAKGYTLGNIDVTIAAEQPKLKPAIPQMEVCIAQLLGVDEDLISIKATTTERMGFEGREDGISTYAVVLIESTKN